MNRARQPAPHPRAIATSGTFQSPLYRASRQTLALLGLIGDWPSSSHTGNRADYLPHIIEKVYMRTMNMNTVLEFSSTSVHQAAGQVETTADADHPGYLHECRRRACQFHLDRFYFLD